MSNNLVIKGDDLSAILKTLKILLKTQERKQEEGEGRYIIYRGNLSNLLKHQSRFKLKKIEDLSIPDTDYFIAIISYLRVGGNLLKEKLNYLLDKKFQKICGSCLLIKLEYNNPYLVLSCDVEILYHYINAKKKLHRLDELKGDKKLALILRKTYNLEKQVWFQEKNLQPNHNKWVHFILGLNKLGALESEEKIAILKHNAKLKINKKLPILAQLWNRTWLFSGLGIRNVKNLRSIFFNNQEFLEAKKNICDSVPKISNFEKEDLFLEGSNIMQGKYIAIKNFCNLNF